MLPLVDGLLAGAGHVIAGPDHLAGVAPLAIERHHRSRPWLVGAYWGLGHGLGVAVLAILGQTLLSVAAIEIASAWAESLVGIVLIALGAIAIRRARGLVVHEHVHVHDGSAHSHLHVHHRADAHDQLPRHQHRHAAFGIGILHGLAGGTHFLAALPTLAMTPLGATVYVASYMAATVAVMALFGAVVGRVTASCGQHAVRRFMVAVGVVTIAIGVVWLTL